MEELIMSKLMYKGVEYGTKQVVYCTCSTAASTAAKVADIDDGSDFELKAGAIAIVKFTKNNSATNCTLNVGDTGAKSIWYGTSVFTGSTQAVCGTANRSNMYVYDGTYWVWMSYSQYDTDTDTTYTPASLGFGYGTCDTAASSTAKVVTLSGYTLKNGIVSVKFTYAVTAGATLNVNSKGAKAIYYRGSAITAGVINAGDTATFIYNGSYYHLISVDRANKLTINLNGDGAVSRSFDGSQNIEVDIEPGDIGAASQSTVDAIKKTIGSTSISSIGDGTVTGALSSLNSSLGNKPDAGSETYFSGIHMGGSTKQAFIYTDNGNDILFQVNVNGTLKYTSISAIIKAING
jgi:hypothetical protein